MTPEKNPAPPADIDTRIHTIRGISALLDSDLASLYGVAPGVLLQAVRRNRKRFPPDFIFQLTDQDLTNGGRRYKTFAFSEQGVAMLSSVLRSDTAIRVNIEIMRAFVRLRRASLVSQKLMSLIEDLSTRVDSHDAAINELVESIRQIVAAPAKGRSRPIGFTADVEVGKASKRK